MPLVFLPQILWHSKDNKQCDRVYALDFQPGGGKLQHGSTRSFKLATGGADEFVHIWRVVIHDNAPQYATHGNKSILAPENQRPTASAGELGVERVPPPPFTVKVLARLTGHIGEVNALRWSPNGRMLASGGEDRCIFLWARTEGGGNLVDGGNQDYEEHYSRFQYYRLSHVVNSIGWCPDGRLLSVSTEDGHVSLIDTFVEGTGRIRHFEGHTSFAQGVAICPKNILIASMGQDQTLRIWKRRNEKQWKNILVLRSAKDRSEFKESIGMESDDVRYSRSVFMNEELSTFFRRLDWSPDGRFLVTPAGIRHNALFRKEDDPEPKNDSAYTLYVFHRKLIHLGIPMVTHLSPAGPFVAVKFCPLDLTKIEKEKMNFFNKLFKQKPKSSKQKRTRHAAKRTTGAEATTPGDACKLRDSPNGVDTPLVSVKTEGTITDADDGGVDDGGEDITGVDGDVDADMNDSDVKREDSATLTGMVSEESDASMHPLSPANVAHAHVKLEGGQLPNLPAAAHCDDVTMAISPVAAGAPGFKVEGALEMVEAAPEVKDEHIAVPEIDLSASVISEPIDCGRSTERSTGRADEGAGEGEGEDGSASVRASKRESKRPDFYEATIDINRELRKPSKAKGAKKDEDKEYDTDVEDEVVVPRLMFAAGTLDGSLCFYDTLENRGPIAVLKNLHYCTITDIAWSPDGLVCATASSDGYITFVVFQKKEFY